MRGEFSEVGFFLVGWGGTGPADGVEIFVEVGQNKLVGRGGEVGNVGESEFVSSLDSRARNLFHRCVYRSYSIIGYNLS